jgi:hypothetical protein
MSTRRADTGMMLSPSDQETSGTSGSVDENVSDRTAVPALLYEEVRSITSALKPALASEKEWIEVPLKHCSNSLSQHSHQILEQDSDGSVKATCVSTMEAAEDKEHRRHEGGRGRGSSRGRGRGRFRGTGRGRGRCHINGTSSHTASRDIADSCAGVGTNETNFENMESGNAPGMKEKRRNAGRGRHARRRSGGHDSHAQNRPREKRVSIQSIFAASEER